MQVDANDVIEELLEENKRITKNNAIQSATIKELNKVIEEMKKGESYNG